MQRAALGLPERARRAAGGRGTDELDPGTTAVHWFSVDVAGNTESRYDPNGNGNNYNKEDVTVD